MMIFFFFIAVSIYALGIALEGVDNLRGLEDGESSDKGTSLRSKVDLLCSSQH